MLGSSTPHSQDGSGRNHSHRICRICWHWFLRRFETRILQIQRRQRNLDPHILILRWHSAPWHRLHRTGQIRAQTNRRGSRSPIPHGCRQWIDRRFRRWPARDHIHSHMGRQTRACCHMDGRWQQTADSIKMISFSFLIIDWLFVVFRLLCRPSPWGGGLRIYQLTPHSLRLSRDIHTFLPLQCITHYSYG